jgi:catechol 2,3-dioxygenase-like lactoylglutathione lyase family enzyme
MLISQVELPVSDAVQAARFYGDLLGLPTRTDGVVVRVEVGPSMLQLYPGPVEPGAHHSAITVPEDRFDEAKAWLQERVPLLEWDGLDEFALAAPWNSQSVYFAGPDGILLELIARHDLAAAESSGRFSSTDLLRISEIGLAVPDVAEAVTSLQNAFGLPIFGTAAPEFTPLGDPDGLLIVVRQGRPWFPTTTVTPSLGPIAVTVELPSGGKSLMLTANCRVKAA